MERRKFVIGLGALATGAAAATGTGALTAARLDGRDANIGVANDSDALIRLADGDTDATGEDDGELYVDFDDLGSGDGINPNATYQVGKIDSEGKKGIDEFVAGASGVTPGVSSSDVLHKASVDENNTAFTLQNQTDQDLDIEIFYEGYDPGNFGTALLVGEGGSYGAAAMAIDPENDDNAGRLGGFPLGSGDNFHVSFLIVTGDGPVDEHVDDWDGELIVQAADEDVDYVD